MIKIQTRGEERNLSREAAGEREREEKTIIKKFSPFFLSFFLPPLSLLSLLSKDFTFILCFLLLYHEIPISASLSLLSLSLYLLMSSSKPLHFLLLLGFCVSLSVSACRRCCSSWSSFTRIHC